MFAANTTCCRPRLELSTRRRIAGEYPDVTPDRATSDATGPDAEPVPFAAARRGGRLLHGREQVTTQELAAEEGGVEAGEVARGRGHRSCRPRPGDAEVGGVGGVASRRLSQVAARRQIPARARRRKCTRGWEIGVVEAEERTEDSPPHLLIDPPAGNRLGDHADEDVVRVRVRPARPRLEPRLVGRRERHELARHPPAPGFRAQSSDEPVVLCVPVDPAPVPKQMPNRDRPAIGTSPGSHRSTGSSSASRPSPASWSITVARNVFVTLPIRKWSSTRIGRFRRRSAYPAAPARAPCSSWIATSAPGAPAETIRCARCRSVGGAPGVPGPRSASRRRRAQTTRPRLGNRTAGCVASPHCPTGGGANSVPRRLLHPLLCEHLCS